MENRLYFVVLNRYHFRTNALLGLSIIPVEASSEEEAGQIAWEKRGDDFASIRTCFEVDKTAESEYTVYRSAFPNWGKI